MVVLLMVILSGLKKNLVKQIPTLIFYVTIDSSDFIYATGDFSDTIDIDPDPVDTFGIN